MMINQKRTIGLVIKKRCRLLKDAASSTVGGVHGEKGEKLGGPSFCLSGRPPPAARDEPKLFLLLHL